MTHYISEIPIAVIEEVEINASETKDELDLVDKNSNIIINGPEGAREITVDFVLVEDEHPEKATVEDQREEVKELTANDAEDNYFDYNNENYFVSVEDVNVPESSQIPTMRSGSFSGKLLPWPKHFPDSRTSQDKRIGGGVDYRWFADGSLGRLNFLGGGVLDFVLATDGDIFSTDTFLDGENIEYIFSTEGDAFRVRDAFSEVEHSMLTSALSNKQHSLDATPEYTFSMHGLGGFGSDFGTEPIQLNAYFSLDIDSLLSLLTSVHLSRIIYLENPEFDYSFDLQGSIVNLEEVEAIVGLLFGLDSGVNRIASLEVDAVSGASMVIDIDGEITFFITVSSSVDYSLSLDGNIETAGDDYGSGIYGDGSYGELTGYGSGIYGRGTYGEGYGSGVWGNGTYSSKNI